MQKSNINCGLLKVHLDFLINNMMIEEKTLKKGTAYALTDRGTQTLRAFNEIAQLFSSEKKSRFALTQNSSIFNR
jgi:predicted transcriptional regulator